jgi:hypothetical protein
MMSFGRCPRLGCCLGACCACLQVNRYKLLRFCNFWVETHEPPCNTAQSLVQKFGFKESADPALCDTVSCGPCSVILTLPYLDGLVAAYVVPPNTESRLTGLPSGYVICDTCCLKEVSLPARGSVGEP